MRPERFVDGSAAGWEPVESYGENEDADNAHEERGSCLAQQSDGPAKVVPCSPSGDCGQHAEGYSDERGKYECCDAQLDGGAEFFENYGADVSFGEESDPEIAGDDTAEPDEVLDD